MSIERRSSGAEPGAAARLAAEAARIVRQSGEEGSGERLISIAREWEAAYGTVRRALREVGGRFEAGRGRPSWMLPGGLELASVSLDARRRTISVRYRDGREVSLPFSALRLRRKPVAAALDDLRHAVVLELSNGQVEEVASDLFLYETDTEYRAAHAARSPPPPLGPRIRELRISLGLRAAHVAKAAGLAPSNYARLEAGGHEPRMDTLVRVAAALQVPLWRVLPAIDEAGRRLAPRLARRRG